MKKQLVILMLVLQTVLASAARHDNYLLYESFESLGLPTGWTEEQVSGSVSWQVELGASAVNPVGAYEGNNRLSIRNSGTQTEHFITRLISPSFDLTGVANPVVMFAHAQQQWAGDADNLRVYYRTSSTSRWILLQEFSEIIPQWRLDTISLPAASSTYQLAFEAYDNLGRGIVIDDVAVRPKPICSDPANITIQGLTRNSVSMRWIGSFDTDSFKVVISKSALNDPNEENTSILYSGFVYDFEYSSEAILSQDTHYNFYIQAFCGEDRSEWVRMDFTTLNRIDLPYKENFDKEYVVDAVSQVEYWTHGTSIRLSDGSYEKVPCINQNLVAADRYRLSYSNTTCLAFVGSTNVDKTIPRSHYAYAATPEINVESLRNVEVEFWGTSGIHGVQECACGLIVGVMTDPADVNTFVPVDTVYELEPMVFNRFTIYFDKYQGDGKYIAFMSNFFAQDNGFFIDDLVIREVPEVRVPTEVSISNLTSKGFMVNANQHNETGCRVYVTNPILDGNNRVVLDPTIIPTSDILIKQDFNQMPAVIEIPEDKLSVMRGQFVEIYVLNKKDGAYSVSSLPYKVMIPMHYDGTLYSTSFEKAIGQSWNISDAKDFTCAQYTGYLPKGIMSNGTVFRSRSQNNKQWEFWATAINDKTIAYKTDCYLSLAKSEMEVYSEVSGARYTCTSKYGDYIALPEVDDLSSVMLEFYMRAGVDNGIVANVAVGVMTDPNDVTTFEQICNFETDAVTYSAYIVKFDAYKGKGHFPAIMAIKAQEPYQSSKVTYGDMIFTDIKASYQFIDELTLRKSDDCVVASDIKINVSAEKADQAEVTWLANGSKNWLVTIYSNKQCTDTVQSIAVVQPYCLVQGLNPHSTYYVKVATVCTDNSQIVSEYQQFSTPCMAEEKIPYLENFDQYSGGVKSGDHPFCWTMNEIIKTGSYYPYINNSPAFSHSSPGSFNFYYGAVTVANTLSGAGYFALPPMSEPLNKLQLSFWMRGQAANESVYVGVMTDPNNFSTFDTIATVRSATTMTEYILRLADYQGNGRYLAFVKDAENLSKQLYIDDILLDYLAGCWKTQGVEVTNIKEHSAIVMFQKDVGTTWDIVLATKEVALGTTVTVDGTDILSCTRTHDAPFVITNCPEIDTEYVVYVRVVCDEDVVGDWSEPVWFKTACESHTPQEYGVFTFSDPSDLNCWITGMQSGANTSSLGNNLPTISAGALYMFNTNKTNGAYATMPMMIVDSINHYQVSFDAHGGNNTTYLKELTVGITTNPFDMSTFIEIQTVDLDQVTTVTDFSTARHYVVRFNNYVGDYDENYGKYITFYSNNKNMANYIYIDNISVDSIEGCLVPTSIRAKEIDATSITFQWENVGTKYQVQLMNDKKAVVRDTILTSDTIRFDHLDLISDYTARIRTICDVGDTSIWRVSGICSTICPEVYTLPYADNFDYPIINTTAPRTIPHCWTTWYDSSANGVGAYGIVSTTAKKDGVAGVYLGSSNTKTTYLVLPQMDAKINESMLSFDFKTTATSGFATLKIGATDTPDDWTQLQEQVDWIDEIHTDGSTNWIHYGGMLSSYQGSKKYIVIAAVNGLGNGTTALAYVYLDNLLVERIPTCFRPINLKMNTSTARSITFSWTPYGDETVWEATCVKAGRIIGENPIVRVQEPKAIIEGLEPGTEYDLYVRAVCGENDKSEWQEPITKSTQCLVDVADAFWDFEDLNDRHIINGSTGTTTKITNCWYSDNWYYKGNTTSPNNVPKVLPDGAPASAKYGYGDSEYVLYFTTTPLYVPAYATMPEMNADLDSLQVSFVASSAYISARSNGNVGNTYAKDPYVHAIKVGTMVDPYDYSTFEELADIHFAQIASSNLSQFSSADDLWTQCTVALSGAKGKYIAFVSDYKSNSNTVYIDNVRIEKLSSTPAPTKVSLDINSLSDTHAIFSWYGTASKYNIRVYSGKDTVVATEVTSMNLVTDALQANTEYTFAVQSIYEAGVSAWTNMNFTTPCTPLTNMGSWNFEKDLYQYGANSTYLIPGCWTVGSTTHATQSYIPYAIANTSSVAYARGDHATSQRALEFYVSASNYDAYAIMPPMSIDMDSTALHFFYRSTYISKLTTGAMAANSAYNKNIVVGYVTNADIETFVPVDTVTYTFNVTASNTCTEREDEWWSEITLPLSAYAGSGRQIAFRYCQEKPAGTGYFFIDDIEIVPRHFCTPLSSLSVKNLSDTSVALAWSVDGIDSVHLQIATDAMFTQILVDKILVNAKGNYVNNQLTAGTQYFVRMKHCCEEDIESDWIETAFCTYYNMCFLEQFNEHNLVPTNWKRYTGDVKQIIAGVTQLTELSPTKEYTWIQDNNNEDIRIQTNLGASDFAANSCWLVTPQISTMGYEKDSILLSFALYLTSLSGASPNPVAQDDEFNVVVSDDGGLSWKLADSWTSTSEHRFDEINAQKQAFCVDLTSYVGKVIMIGFNYSARNFYANNYLHLDNVKLNTFHAKQYSRNICEWYDYDDGVFNILASKLKIGTKKYEKIVISEKPNTPDLLTILDLTVNPSVAYSYDYTICQGDDYVDNGFVIRHPNTNAVYKQKLPGFNTCDSVVILNLMVLPSSHDTISATICQGNYYEFGNAKYYFNTVAIDTFKSVLTGCDSIMTLMLSVNETLHGDEIIHLCQGDSYKSVSLGDLSISGDYDDNIKTESGCDSIAHLHIFVHDSVHTYSRVLICSGDKYHNGAFDGLSTAGVYTLNNQTVYGCDSLATLFLLVADAETMTATDHITTNDLPYILNDEEILPINTANGIYTHNVLLPCGEVSLTIIVGEKSSVNNLWCNDTNIRKVVVDDKIFIIVNDIWYDVLGKKIDALK